MMSDPPTASRTKIRRQVFAGRPRQQIWFLLVGVGVLLLGVGAWTYNAVQETIHDQLTEGLQTILQANIEALQIVVENERGHIQAWAKDADIRILTQQILSGQNVDRAREELNAVLANVLAEDGYLGYAIIDPDGVILATDQPEPYLGKSLSPLAMELLGAVLADESSFEKPFPQNALIEETAGTSSRPVLLAKASIPDITGQNIAALVFTIDPEKDFTRILSVAEFGRTGSTYAFDNQGVMLSESRHEEQLKSIGLVPNTPEASAILTLQLRDPGVDLTSKKISGQTSAELPLTHMAKEAIHGRSGINVEGYRDFRGVKVIGAWQWLDEYGFGIATEVERSDALRSLRPVRLAFFGLFGLLVVSAAGFLVISLVLKRLQKKIDALRELGQYTLVEKIGEGGMGQVYKARHAMLRRPTAIKLIREDQLDEQALARFEQEVQLTSQLTHPNTISIYDYGHSPDGVFYYAMEYLSGITLDQLVKIEVPLPVGRVVHILSQVCGSLAEAHAKGLIHRDIKPGNIMLCQRGGTYDFVKVLDFGLVREIKTHITQDFSHHQPIMGTPGFIAPELLMVDHKVDARSDLYSLGALGFLLLTGQKLFANTDLNTMLRDIVQSDPPRPSAQTDLKLPKTLDDLLFNCLSRNPEDRPDSAKQLAEQLAKVPLDQIWTQQNAFNWWQKQHERIAFERKLGRPSTSNAFQTVMDIDFGERA
ncbi:MAG: serine/threonine protein kinase [Deltaproteobacteria bacterium]|jgi:serine/threonine protein kinase|nr:serine/threonine protein kinase [Deltaproteobacteria bacterium]